MTGRSFYPPMSKTVREEECYRRGFDQGVSRMAYALGIQPKELNSLLYKKRVSLWRKFKTPEDLGPCELSLEEKEECAALVKKIVAMKLLQGEAG